MKNGNIYAIDCNNNIKHFKNLAINSMFIEKTGKGSIKASEANENIKIFCSANSDRIVVSNGMLLSIWYQSDLIVLNNNNQKNKQQIKNSGFEELTGTFYNISLENEKKNLFTKNNTQETSASNGRALFEALAATFGNNHYYGSFSRIIYTLMIPKSENNQQYKLVFIDYIFKYESSNNLRAADFDCNNENLSNIDKKVIYSYINYSMDKSADNLNIIKTKERILMKFNKSGNSCAIVINSHHALNSYLLIYQTETYNFSISKLLDIYSKGKLPKNEGSILIWIEDITWVSDLFIVVLFSCGYFAILNINLQLVSFVDISNSIYSNSKNCEEIACPLYLYSNLLKFTDKLQLLSSKKRGEYFFIYSNNYSICYQIIHKNYEGVLASIENLNGKFDDFLYLIKYFQMFPSEMESDLFDKIHLNIVKYLKELYNPETEVITMPNENISQIFDVFVKFLKIFRSINLLHETNLTLISYLIGVSNDFFNHLLNFKEIWLAFLFNEICENYLLKHLKLKHNRPKLQDKCLQNSETVFSIFNPSLGDKTSFKNFNKISNKMLFSRQRMNLILFSLIEFRNNQALNINVLYFVLAKLCLDKMKQVNLLDDIHLLVKIIIKNWKFLKTENSKNSKEELVLNSITINLKSEILSHCIHTRYPRSDIKFQFFREFFSMEDLQSFNELNEMYSKGGEENLINEYNYMNNLAVVQKWILFFTNYFYGFLFEDLKNYIHNHVLKFHMSKKSVENISPEETNLSNLIYFNFTFFMLAIKNYLKHFLNYMTLKSENSFDSNFISDDPNILYNFGKVFLPFISPVDVPFAIFEFYSLEDHKQKKNLPYEINKNLNDLIKRHFKNFNISLNDCIDFAEFLINIGFSGNIDSEKKEDNLAATNKQNKIQKILFSIFVFYIFIIHKLHQLHFLVDENNLIFSVINNLEIKLKNEIYELLFLILNGLLKFYLKKESLGKLIPNNSKYLEIVLTFIKSVFYKILREEPIYIRRNIFEFIYITPASLKSYLIEGALFYEYRNFSRLIKNNLFDSRGLLEISNYEEKENSDPDKDINLFDKIFDVSKVNDLCKILNLNFNTNKNSKSEYLNSNEKETYLNNFRSSMYNLLMLTKIEDGMIFSLESNKEYIRSLVGQIESDPKKNQEEDQKEKSFSDVLSSSVDKIIKGNFENKSIFKFSCSQLKTKLTKSIKIIIAKFLHVLNVLDLKFQILNFLNPSKDILNYLKYLSYCLLYGKENTLKDDVNNCLKIIDFLWITELKNLNKSEENNFIEIIKNFNILFIKIGKDFSNHALMNKLEEKMKTQNRNLYLKCKDLYKQNGIINRIKTTHDNLTAIKSSNLKMFLVMCHSDFYIDNLFNIFNQMKIFLASQKIEIPLKRAKSNYIKFSESFMNLTGIPMKAFVDFEENWHLVNDDILYNLIVHDKYQVDTLSDNFDLRDPKQNLIINTRQMSGFDTPRSRNKKIILNHFEYKVEESDKKVNQNTLDISISKNDLNKSIEIREENEDENSKNKNKISVATKLRVKTYKKKAILPRYGEKRFNRGDRLKTESLNASRSEDKEENHSLATVTNEKDNSIYVEQNINNNIKQFSGFFNKLRKSFFDNLKSRVFQKFKQESASKELEQIKIINYKAGEGIIDMIVLKEKFIPDKEIHIKPINVSTSYHSGNKKEIRSGNNSLIKDLNSNSLNEVSLKDNANKNKFRPFDLINISKFKSGKGENSILYKELLKNKNNGNIQQIIKSKIDEIQEKLKKYEEMAMNLEKEFKASFDY